MVNCMISTALSWELAIYKFENVFLLLLPPFSSSGRDGLTHNMLDNIHALWKRRRVCKIKCKGVCTVDMDNVCQQLEVGMFSLLFCKRRFCLIFFRYFCRIFL